jgi:hypothetical protein
MIDNSALLARQIAVRLCLLRVAAVGMAIARAMVPERRLRAQT